MTLTNLCAIGLTLADGTLILTSAIDNLIKGAAGQAVQNMNVMLGIEEEAGLIGARTSKVHSIAPQLAPSSL